MPPRFPKSAPPYDLRIAVQNFTPVTATRNSDPIIVPRYRGEIENSNDDLVAAARLAHEAQHTLLRIAAVDPLEPRRIAVQFMQSPFRAIGLIQIRHPLLKSVDVSFILQQVPFQTAVVRPFAPIARTHHP